MKFFRKIAKYKYQLLFFACLAFLLTFAIVMGSIDKPSDVNTGIKVPPVDDPVEIKPQEKIAYPIDFEDYVIVRKFYEKDASKEDQKKSLIKYNNTYKTSTGTSFKKEDNSTFDVLAILSGKVIEVKSSPLYNNYVVIEHQDGVKSFYYGLSEVLVKPNDEVSQGAKLGISGKTEIDQEAGNHVYLKLVKNGKAYNIERLVNKELSQIE